MKFFTKQLAAVALTLSAGTAVASPVLTDLTTNDYITVGSLDWAWAGAVTSANYYNWVFEQPASLHPGWREASDLEWFTHPTAIDFGGKCASQYWSNINWCDFQDPVSQHLDLVSNTNWYDLLYVRDSKSVNTPEPTSILMLGLGLLGLGYARRRAAK